jgi:hypothetical protein
MIDYAMPTMMAEKALKDLHDAMLLGKYDQALAFAVAAIAEACKAYEAIAVMKDNQYAR